MSAPATKRDDPLDEIRDSSPPDPFLAGLAKLREPFPEKTIGKLPRVTCKACRDRRCQQHKQTKCAVCDAYITTAHIHLDYVGHAEVTDRLLSVDPRWSWEPLAWAEGGLPRFTMAGPEGAPIGLWIRLTVLGVTRLGYGSVEPDAFDAEKQLIGDALRNAAMRFGVALDLWSKTELESAPEAVADGEPKTSDLAPVREPEREEPASTIKPPTSPRAVLGIPISVTKDWAMVRTAPIGGKSKYAKSNWGALLDAGDPSEEIEWLESSPVRMAQEEWARIAPEAKKKGLTVLPTLQYALIAYDELQKRRSPPPADTGIAGVEEWAEADEPGSRG